MEHYKNIKNYDVIDVCKDYSLNFNRGNVIKYVVRAGKKESEVENIEIDRFRKQDISSLFEDNIKLAKIGSQEDYAQYIEGIFPKSEVDYFLYHGTNAKFETFDKTTWNRETTEGFESKGFWFNHLKDEAETYGTVKSVLINAVNPYRKPVKYENYEEVFADQVADINNALEQGNDSAILDINEGGFDGANPVTEYVVFEPNQIHVLGSEHDISGFENFIKNKQNEKTKNTKARDFIRFN